MIRGVRKKAGRVAVVLAAVALTAAMLAIAGAAFPAGARETWRWEAQDGPLASTASGVDEITLSVENVGGESSTLVVADNGHELQTATSFDASRAVLAFSVTDSSGGRAVVGVARSDVAHLYATMDGTPQEIPLNAAGAFAIGGLPAGATVGLQALASDGSTIEASTLPETSPACIGVSACSRTPSASAPRTAQGSGGTGIPHAFARPATPRDKLPANAPFRRGIVGAGGARQKILATRRIATYTDGRGRRALLYLFRTPHEICEFTLWRGGAGGGCNNASNFFAGRHVVAGSGHLITGVVDDTVAELVVVGTRGGRHRVTPTADGGFIYDCRAYSGCTGCIVDHLEALDSAGQTIESDRVTGGCTRRTNASAPPISSLKSLPPPPKLPADYVREVGRIASLAGITRETAVARTRLLLSDVTGLPLYAFVGNDGQVCFVVWRGAGTCGFLAGKHNAIWAVNGGSRKRGQAVVGVVADSVTRVKVMLGGHAIPVRFRHNAFVAPFRLERGQRMPRVSLVATSR